MAHCSSAGGSGAAEAVAVLRSPCINFGPLKISQCHTCGCRAQLSPDATCVGIRLLGASPPARCDTQQHTGAAICAANLSNLPTIGTLLRPSQTAPACGHPTQPFWAISPPDQVCGGRSSAGVSGRGTDRGGSPQNAGTGPSLFRTTDSQVLLLSPVPPLTPGSHEGDLVIFMAWLFSREIFWHCWQQPVGVGTAPRDWLVIRGGG